MEMNQEKATINLEEELKGSEAACLFHELVSWFMAYWIPDPNGLSEILFSGN